MGTLARVVGTWPGKGSRASFWKFEGGEHTLASGEAEGTACAKAKRRASLEMVGNLEGEPAGREGSSLGGGLCCPHWKGGHSGNRRPFPGPAKEGMMGNLFPAKGKPSPSCTDPGSLQAPWSPSVSPPHWHPPPYLLSWASFEQRGAPPALC